jgi:polyisoprenoid-binding protein YceI
MYKSKSSRKRGVNVNSLIGYQQFVLRLLFAGTLVVLSNVSSADLKKEFTADNKNSEVGFSGEHAGMDFSGLFESWQATLRLPPLEQAKIEASFDLRTAKTGDFTYDSTLPEGDWFDVENHPEGSFVSESIEVSDKGYRVTGLLTLRGISKIQSFELVNADNRLVADFEINRLDYAIGLDSDPEAEWVSRDIQMRLDISY